MTTNKPAIDTAEFRFAFHARDFEAAVAFYRDVLGLIPVGGWDRPDGKGALLRAGATAVIEIYGAAEGTVYQGPAPSPAINLAIRVESPAAVDRWFESLRATGHASEPPADHPWGHRSFVVHDPDGIPVHLYAETN